MLTDEQILAEWSGPGNRPVIGKNKVLAFDRAIESAVRQSTQSAEPHANLLADATVRQDAARMRAFADEADRARRGIDSRTPIWDALCDAFGDDGDGDKMRAAIDAALKGTP